MREATGALGALGSFLFQESSLSYSLILRENKRQATDKRPEGSDWHTIFKYTYIYSRQVTVL